MKLSTLLLLVPVAAIAVILALANREIVDFRLLPFTQEPATVLAMPLFLLVFLSFFLGVLVGGAVMACRRSGIGRTAKLSHSDKGRVDQIKS